MLASGSWGLAWPRPCWAFHLYPWCFLNDASNSTTFAPHAHNNWKKSPTAAGPSTDSNANRAFHIYLWCMKYTHQAPNSWIVLPPAAGVGRLGSGGWRRGTPLYILSFFCIFDPPPTPTLKPWRRARHYLRTAAYSAAARFDCADRPARFTGPAKNLACWEKYAAIDRKCATNLGYICKHRTYLSIGNQWCWTILQII